MCGIAGLADAIGLTDADQHLADEMLGSLAHRGPDEQRIHSERVVALGARRLSIIDLETGSQPLGNEDDSVIVTQNGEIYNYLELREELVRQGHRFRTHGDTEVIAHLYEQHGDDFVDHLRGMFAIAVWDVRRQRLLLARDRLGKKPLYWRADASRLWYGSELKAILADPSTPRSIDREALAQYLQYQYVPSPKTILAGVHKLPPASMLVWEDGTVRVRRYWTPSYAPKLDLTLDEARDQCLAILREAVRLRLRSDVPLGLFLSGGMDSSVVLGLMTEASERPVRTFTIGFDEVTHDERHYARAVADHFGAEHTEEIVRLDAVAMLPDLAYHFDEPMADSSALPTFRVAQIAGQSVRVVLTGDGGDEAFGGYARYLSQASFERMRLLPAAFRRAAARGRLATHRARGQWVASDASDVSLVDLAGMSRDARYVQLMSTSGQDLRSRLLGSDADASQDRYLLDLAATGPAETLDRMLYVDSLSYLPEDLLVKMDRATMAHSLEARSPLLDQEVAAFAARLPASRKLQGSTTKVVLREVALSLMPRRMVERPKSGFGVPLSGWFRGPLGEVYRDTVLAPNSRLRDHLDQRVAGQLLRSHQDGTIDGSARLWVLLTFEMWARRWLASVGETHEAMVA